MIQKINSHKATEYIYCIIVSTITVLGWYFKSKWGYMSLVPVTLIALLVFNDFKYMIMSMLGLIFSNGIGFNKDTAEFPMTYAITMGMYALLALVFLARNGIRLRKLSSGKGLLLFAIMAPIPLIWNNIVAETQKIMYFVYLSYLLYFLIYLLFLVTLKKDSFRMAKTSMIFSGLLVATECILLTVDSFKAGGSFVKTYSVGWAMAIDAGVVMIMALPFVIINLVHETKWLKMVYYHFVIAIISAGIFCTCSRGSYIFGLAEVVILIFVGAIVSKRRWVYLLELAAVILIFSLTVFYTVGFVKVYDTFINQTFALDLDSNGRTRIWLDGISKWNNGFLPVTFGLGTIAIPDIYGLGIVYMHSTAVEILVKFGIVGCIILLFHFGEKYIQMFKKLDYRTITILFIGMLCLDTYGMIECIFGCYYYMIPLGIILASIDVFEKNKTINNELANA